MKWKKFFRRILIAFSVGIFLLSAAIVCAAVQTFDGYGECEMGEFAPLPKARERALERAKFDAQKKAGLYLKTESHSLNSELVDDVISAVTNNIAEISDVQYENITQKITDKTTVIVVVARLKANINPNGIYDFLKRDDKEKVAIVQQNKSLQNAIAENDKEFEELKEQYKRATTQTEKDKILKQLDEADRKFLANQKNEESAKLYYAKDYAGAIKILNEAIELNPNSFTLYYNRGTIYYKLNQYEQAVTDFDSAIQLNPNLCQAYHGRGSAYYELKQYEPALQDLDKAVQIDSDDFNLYNKRGNIYKDLGQYERAIQDYDKSIRLNPNNYYVYCNRAHVYYKLGQYEQAVKDFDKTILINPNDDLAYSYRGLAYAQLGDFNQAIADVNKAVELNPNAKYHYRFRGILYQKIGEEAKAQADFAKAEELN